jgi:hypothetical protein
MSGLSMKEMRVMDDSQIGKMIYDSLTKTDQIKIKDSFHDLDLKGIKVELGKLYREAYYNDEDEDDDVENEDFQIFAGYLLDDDDDE